MACMGHSFGNSLGETHVVVVLSQPLFQWWLQSQGGCCVDLISWDVLVTRRHQGARACAGKKPRFLAYMALVFAVYPGVVPECVCSLALLPCLTLMLPRGLAGIPCLGGPTALDYKPNRGSPFNRTFCSFHMFTLFPTIMEAVRRICERSIHPLQKTRRANSWGKPQVLVHVSWGTKTRNHQSSCPKLAACGFEPSSDPSGSNHPEVWGGAKNVRREGGGGGGGLGGRGA